MAPRSTARLLAAFAVGLAATLSIVGLTTVRDARYRDLIRSGEEALELDRQGAAVEAFSGAIAIRPQSMLPYLRRGESYQRSGDLPAALRDVTSATVLDPTAPQPWERLGDVNLGLERYPQASAAFDRSLALDDQSADVLYKSALADFRSGRDETSFQRVRQAISLAPRTAAFHHLQGLHYARRGDTASAIEAFELAARLAPALLAPREELALLYGREGRTTEALQQLDMLAALDPLRVERHVALARAYLAANQDGLASLALERASARHAGEPALEIIRAELWLRATSRTGDQDPLDRALALLTPLAARRDVSSATLTLYGRALLLTGDWEGAALALQRAASRLPVAEDALTLLENVSHRLGHEETARWAARRRGLLWTTGSR